MEKRTKEEQVADLLREGILSGKFPRGSRLKQLDISNELGISITPVREALRILEAEGYVTGGSYRGVIVSPIDVASSTEILQLRLMLESFLVTHAVEKARSSDIDELHILANEFSEAGAQNDRDKARGANYRFHRRLYDIADCSQTLHFVQTLWARYPFDIINIAPGRMSTAIREHDEIMKSIIAGDAGGAILAMRQHIESGWDAFNESIKNIECG